MSLDNEYLWRRPGSPTTAERILEAAAKDAGRPYDDEAERRHQRRLKAMRSLGDAERRLDRILLWGPILMLAVVALVIGLALA